MSEHLVAVFATGTAANMAVDDLRENGISDSAIRVYDPDQQQSLDPPESDAFSNFWTWLFGGDTDQASKHQDIFPGDEEQYEQAMEDGNTLVTVTLDDETDIQTATTILWRNHPLELDETNDGVTHAVAPPTTPPPPATPVPPPVAAPIPETVDERTGSPGHDPSGLTDRRVRRYGA